MSDLKLITPHNLKERLLSILKELSLYIAPSGFESNIKQYLIQLTKDLTLYSKEDVFGNIFWVKKGLSEKTIMIIAHLDEVGLIVKNVDKSGFIRIDRVGGVNPQLLRGTKIKIMHDDKIVNGIIGCKPYHMKDGPKPGDIEFSDLWVDIGVDNRYNALQEIAIGDVAVVESSFVELYNSLVSGRAMDNHAGLAAMMLIMGMLNNSNTDYNIVFVASSQEELGGRGAIIAASNINPDIAIAIDTCHATDYPTVNTAKYGDIKLGNGSIIPIGTDYSQAIQKKLKETALSINTPIQIEAGAGPSGTDINKIQTAGHGCLTGLVGIPCRYMHTPNEVVSLKDIVSCIEVISEFIKKLKGEAESL